MPLEAVMICVDNSDFTRNGDYTPTRFESQTDAVNLLCGAKTNQNPENSVGLLATAGDRIEVMITPTTDLGKMVSELPKINIGGTADVLRGIQTAQLALKHRQNKNQKQRIIAFVGSPILSTEKELETLGKNLKKNNVSLDLVSFGEVEENTAKLEKLLNAVNSNESSHMVEVPVGPKLLSDVLLSSVIVNPDGEAAAAAGGGGDGFEFGINPNDDPELALALRISMEEARAREQQAGGGDAAPTAGTAEATAAPAGGGAEPAAAAAGVAPSAEAASGAMPMATDAALMEAMGMEDMDEELRQALLLSMQEVEPAEAPAAAEGKTDGAEVTPQAEAPSAAPPAKAEATPAPTGEVDASYQQLLQDPDFVQELLGSLPGVDINDPSIQSALNQAGGKDPKGDGGEGSGGSGSGSGSK